MLYLMIDISVLWLRQLLYITFRNASSCNEASYLLLVTFATLWILSQI